ncbi:MAG: class IV adenylate cyclase [Gemmatimonadaceae bacterium]
MSAPTREVEVKARVDDIDAARARMQTAGGVLRFEGDLSDRIYDTTDGALSAQDQVLRVRTYLGDTSTTSHIDWKGRTVSDGGFKVREELTSGITDHAAIASILERLGYHVTSSIDRWIAQYELSDEAGQGGVVTIRFERYPKMDTLVEVEGSPTGIERAITVLGIPRDRFSADRLADFVAAYEARTGDRAEVCLKGPSAR